MLNLIFVHFKEFFRQPEIIFWSIIFPIVMAGILGLAFMNQREPERTVALIDTPFLSDKIENEILNATKVGGLGTTTIEDKLTPSISIIKYSKQQALTKIKRGEISLLVEASPQGDFIFHFDPSNAEARLTYLLLKDKLAMLQLKSSISSVQPITDTGNRYIDFLVPGLIALGIMNTCMWGIGWNLIESRIKKLMRRMIATPMKKSSFLLAHLFTRLFLGLIEATLVFTFAYIAFDVSVKGSIIALLAVYLTGIIAFWGIAVLTSSRAETMASGNGIINAVVLPMTMLSGVFFSYQGFPDVIVNIIKLFPLTILTDTLRAIFNEGAGLKEIVFPIIILLFTGFISFFIGLRIYKWY